MKITFSPDEGEAREWPFDIQRLMVTELEAVEKVTGLSYLEFADGLDHASVKAYRALVWVLRKRSGEPTLKYSEVDFPIGALALVADVPDETPDVDEDGPDLPKAKPAPRKPAAGAS